MKIYSPTVVEGRSSNSRCGQGFPLSEGCRGEFFLSIIQRLLAFLGW
jgi:hypothetical protein